MTTLLSALPETVYVYVSAERSIILQRSDPESIFSFSLGVFFIFVFPVTVFKVEKKNKNLKISKYFTSMLYYSVMQYPRMPKSLAAVKRWLLRV